MYDKPVIIIINQKQQQMFCTNNMYKKYAISRTNNRDIKTNHPTLQEHAKIQNQHAVHGLARNPVDWTKEWKLNRVCARLDLYWILNYVSFFMFAFQCNAYNQDTSTIQHDFTWIFVTVVFDLYWNIRWLKHWVRKEWWKFEKQRRLRPMAKRITNSSRRFNQIKTGIINRGIETETKVLIN